VLAVTMVLPCKQQQQQWLQQQHRAHSMHQESLQSLVSATLPNKVCIRCICAVPPVSNSGRVHNAVSTSNNWLQALGAGLEHSYTSRA